MRIAYLAAGAAGMYCGSCLHDNTLAAGLRELGEDILLVPTYTPLRTDEPNESLHRVFYGGINVYLQQKSALFRHTPALFDRLLDAPALLDWLSRRGISTDASQLGDLTVSMLAGEAGRQKKELDKLVDWLERDARPDVVQLSNAMLLGMAGEISRRLRVPVVATLSGEDIFLEKLVEPYYSSARRLMRERAGDVAGFVALNRYYADYMSEYLDVPSERIEVIPHGLNLAGHDRGEAKPPGDEFTIGYFARVCHDKGLHVLVDAFELLCREPNLPPLRLRAAGYLGAADRPYLAEQERKLELAGLEDRFEYAGEVDRQGKITFLQSLDVMSVPTVYRESKGISVLEALANAVPVVLPAHGTFPELIADTGGGVLCAPENPRDLAERLKQLILDRALRERLARDGRRAIHERYHHRRMAAHTREFYKRVLAKPAQASSPSAAVAAPA